jgi:hypothetical protein
MSTQPRNMLGDIVSSSLQAARGNLRCQVFIGHSNFCRGLTLIFQKSLVRSHCVGFGPGSVNHRPVINPKVWDSCASMSYCTHAGRAAHQEPAWRHVLFASKTHAHLTQHQGSCRRVGRESLSPGGFFFIRPANGLGGPAPHPSWPGVKDRPSTGVRLVPNWHRPHVSRAP